MLDHDFLRIGELAKQTNTTPKAIRYYERIGLLAPATRGENQYRLYSRKALDQLRFIRRAKLMGLTLNEVAELIDLASDGACEPLREKLTDMLERKIRETDAQIKSMTMFRDDLKLLHKKLVQTGENQCGTCGAFMPNCDCLPKPKKNESSVRDKVFRADNSPNA
ncbi:MAG: heavy metal-responsive transcriptional regulator [Chloroflexi bacterium]|nr:heavy metal-responsive transcriptional regulator [Chloroflexota bacterium]